MWMNHHAAFDRLKALSFPTAVLAEAFQNHNLSDERAAAVLYGLLAYAMGMSWCLSSSSSSTAPPRPDASPPDDRHSARD